MRGCEPQIWALQDSKTTHLLVAHSTDPQSGTLGRVEGKLRNILTLLIGIVPSQALSVSFEVYPAPL